MSDLRYTLRQLTRRPGISVAVILMLALGIGATTAIFSLYHQILVRPLSVPEPDRLVNLVEPGQQPGTLWCAMPGCGRYDYALSYPMFRELEARQDVFTGVAGHHGPFEANVAFGDGARRGTGMLVSGGYFGVLNLRAAVGRLIGPQDAPREGESAVAVLSHDYWRTRFGGDESIVGRTLIVNGFPLTIIGVASDGFSGTIVGASPDFFVPLTLREWMQPEAMRFQQFEDRFAYWLYAFARLLPGVTREQATDRLAGLHAGIVDELEGPPSAAVPPEVLLDRELALEPGARGQSSVPDTAASPLRLLLAVTTLLMLIVCINVASLLLARSAARRGEISVRASLGAARRRLVKQLLTEAAVPAIIGALLALPVAAVVLRLAGATLPVELADGLGVRLDPWAVLLAAGASLTTVVLVALVPAMHAARADPSVAMKARAAQASGGRRSSVHGAFATAQIAISMVLLALAGLFAQSLANVARVDLGFDADSLIGFSVSPPLNQYDREGMMALGDRIAEELAARPDVGNVALSAWPLLSGGSAGFTITVEGFQAPPGAGGGADTNAVTRGFFGTLSMPLLAGRDFSEDDGPGAPRVAIVNEAFLRKFQLGDEALGHRIGIGSDVEPDIEIVGIVADAKYANVKDAAPAQFFTPLRQQDSLTSLQFYVRSRSDSGALLRAIPGIVSGIDPNLPVDDLATMQGHIRDNVFIDRLVTMLAGAFAGLATLLAAIGIYGVLSFGVVQRTRELAVRLAIGAEPKNLRGMVLRQVATMAGAGGLIGLAGAIVAGRAAEALLFGLSAQDPAILAVAGAFLAVVVIAAGYLPALRASNIAPMEALRHE